MRKRLELTVGSNAKARVPFRRPSSNDNITKPNSPAMIWASIRQSSTAINPTSSSLCWPNYDEKQWTGSERAGIHDLLSNRKDDKVMLCRFDHGQKINRMKTIKSSEIEPK